MQKYICSVFLDPGPITDLPAENANSNQAGFVDALLFLLMLKLLKDVLTFPQKSPARECIQLPKCCRSFCPGSLHSDLENCQGTQLENEIIYYL